MTVSGRAVAYLAAGLTILAAPAVAQQRSARSLFAEGCGGCHGLEGRSVSNLVPDLDGQVGHFLCTPTGRAYLGRLPNVAFFPASDAQVAEILNYVAFTLGGPSAPKTARPYTAVEVARLRADPLTATDLFTQRRRVVDELVTRCSAPDSLHDYKRKGAAAALGGDTR